MTKASLAVLMQPGAPRMQPTGLIIERVGFVYARILAANGIDSKVEERCGGPVLMGFDIFTDVFSSRFSEVLRFRGISR